MTPLELLLCVLLICISAFLSAAEVALFSLSRFQLRSLKENFRPIYRKIKHLLSDPGGVLITILVVNEVLNISLSTLITSFISNQKIVSPHSFPWIPDWAFETLIGILITTPIILLLCEITPKAVGARINQLVATLTANPLTLIYNFFLPIRFVVKKIIHIISRKITKENKRTQELLYEKKHEDTILKESDFMLMVEEGQKEGAMQEVEVEMIRNVFELDKTTVNDVATPLAKVLTLTTTTTVKGALASIRSQRYSRIPVTGTHRKNVVGILYAKDLLRARMQPDALTTPISTLMRKPFFVNSSTRLNTLFRKFKQQKMHMAIVKNPHDEAIGVVTMSDVLETLLDDIYPEESQGTHS